MRDFWRSQEEIALSAPKNVLVLHIVASGEWRRKLFGFFFLFLPEIESFVSLEKHSSNAKSPYEDNPFYLARNVEWSGSSSTLNGQLHLHSCLLCVKTKCGNDQSWSLAVWLGWAGRSISSSAGGMAAVTVTPCPSRSWDCGRGGRRKGWAWLPSTLLEDDVYARRYLDHHGEREGRLKRKGCLILWEPEAVTNYWELQGCSVLAFVFTTKKWRGIAVGEGKKWTFIRNKEVEKFVTHLAAHHRGDRLLVRPFCDVHCHKSWLFQLLMWYM